MIKKVYAFQNTKEILKESSSGGAFTAICEAIFSMSQDVSVYGATFDSELNVIHQKANTLEECKKFRGSKYVQSDMRQVYSKIKVDLESDKTVLFTGTPCQVFAVKAFCEKNCIPMEKLFLVDIICHGATMSSIWKQYKSWLEMKYHSKLVDFQFRYKGSRWKQYPVKAHFANGRELVNAHNIRLYTALFFTGLPLKDSCYQCQFANKDRISDISIGDFWGIQNIMPEFPRKDGVSEILVSTDKGIQVINQIYEMKKSNSEIQIEECKSNEYVKYQHNLCKPTERPQNANRFRQDLKEKEFTYILKVYAGYNLKGKCLHCIKKICGESGLTDILKTLRRK